MSKPVLEECVGTVGGVAGAILGRHVAGPTGATVGGAAGQMLGVYVTNRIDKKIDERKRKSNRAGPRKSTGPKQAHRESASTPDAEESDPDGLTLRLHLG